MPLLLRMGASHPIGPCFSFSILFFAFRKRKKKENQKMKAKGGREGERGHLARRNWLGGRLGLTSWEMDGGWWPTTDDENWSLWKENARQIYIRQRQLVAPTPSNQISISLGTWASLSPHLIKLHCRQHYALQYFGFGFLLWLVL